MLLSARTTKQIIPRAAKRITKRIRLISRQAGLSVAKSVSAQVKDNILTHPGFTNRQKNKAVPSNSLKNSSCSVARQGQPARQKYKLKTAYNHKHVCKVIFRLRHMQKNDLLLQKGTFSNETLQYLSVDLFVVPIC